MNDFFNQTAATRRGVLMGGASAVALMSLPTLAHAQAADQFPVAALAKPGADLPDIVLGDENAPVTIIEYASLTCGACAAFHSRVLPDLKKKYIDTKKAKLIVREFPLDSLAGGAAMLARCAGKDQAYPLLEILFEKRRDWITADPVPALEKIAKQVGFTKKAFDTCLDDQKLLDKIKAIRARASRTFQVSSTPTFFVNGKKLVGVIPLKRFSEVIEPMLKDAEAKKK
ncbi:MAG: DsbA family protein [Pseudomonadota bacterium]